MATYGKNARVSDIVCLCRRVHYGSVEGSVGVLVESFTTILRKLAAEDFASEKLLRHYATRRQIESLPAEIVYIFNRFLYVFMFVYVCQDGGAVGFVDFTTLSFALSSLAQPFDQMGSISEYVFVILSQRKAYAGRFQKETTGKRTGPITKWPLRRLLFTWLEIVFITISPFTKRTKVVPKVFQQVFRVKKLVVRRWGAPNSNYLLAMGWPLLSCHLASL